MQASPASRADDGDHAKLLQMHRYKFFYHPAQMDIKMHK
jgi:hypothetical protein